MRTSLKFLRHYKIDSYKSIIWNVHIKMNAIWHAFSSRCSGKHVKWGLLTLSLLMKNKYQMTGKSVNMKMNTGDVFEPSYPNSLRLPRKQSQRSRDSCARLPRSLFCWAWKNGAFKNSDLKKKKKGLRMWLVWVQKCRKWRSANAPGRSLRCVRAFAQVLNYPNTGSWSAGNSNLCCILAWFFGIVVL